MATYPLAHLIKGPDDYRRQGLQKQILEDTVPEGLRDFNYDRISGRDLDPETFVRIASTPPMMAEARLLLIEEANQMSEATNKAVQTFLDGLAGRSERELVLVIAYAPGSKPPKAIESRISSKQIHDCKHLDENTAPSWVREYVQKKWSRRFSQDAVGALLDRVGMQDAGRLAQEIDKLCQISGDAEVTPALIESACPLSAEGDRFRFTDSILLREPVAAMDQMDRLLSEDPNSAPLLIAILSSQMHQIGMFLARLHAGEPEQAVRKDLGYPKVAAKRQSMMQRWTLAEMDSALDMLFETDFTIKQGADPRRALQGFIQTITFRRPSERGV
jgi:DNA polymerase III subunit delta